jgi:hypothetical protein
VDKALRLLAAAVALVAGAWLLHVSWGLIFRDYKDSPIYVYAIFYTPLWVPGLLLVAIGSRMLFRATVHRESA